MANPLNDITEKEILEALTRSGYLLESEVTKLLADSGFFVESNQTTLDPLTGKSREIDLLAEYYFFDKKFSENRTIAKTRFVFEIKNNTSPFVLLTKMEYSPNIEIWEALKIAETVPSNFKFYPLYSGFYDLLIGDKNESLFTQYCSFTTKKNQEELMASHPENIHSGLSKITYFCEELMEQWAQNDKGKEVEEIFRSFLYLPVLLINQDLYELEILGKKRKLKRVEISRLIFNYHYKQDPKSSIVYVVTKKGLADFLEQMRKTEKLVEENMLKEKRASTK